MSIRHTHPTDEEQFHTLWLKLREVMKNERHLMHADKVQAAIDAITGKKNHPFLGLFAEALECIKGQITPIIIRKAVMCEQVSGKTLKDCFVGKGILSTASFNLWTEENQSGEEEGPYTVSEVGDYCQLEDFMEDLLGTKTVVNAAGTNVWAKFLKSAGYVTSLVRVEQFAIDHLAGRESELCTEHTNCFFVHGKEDNVFIAELIYGGSSWNIGANLLQNTHYVKRRGIKARVFLRGDHTDAT
ncbi:MAG: hypothetical protein WC761_04055 [Candidatus Paceibacterota bacterium]